jgi:hypothetical protein
MKEDLPWTLEKTSMNKNMTQKNNQTTMQFTLSRVHCG